MAGQIIGIYKVTNLINGKSYIGQSINIEGRFKSHKLGKRSSKYLQKEIKQYGLENFKFEILEECLEKDLDKRETYWISYYNSYSANGYNKTNGGKGSPGLVHTLESRRKIKENHAIVKGHKASEETKEKLRQANIGTKNPMYGKIPWNKGKKFGPLSEKRRAEISLQTRGENNPCYGKKAMNNGKISKYIEKDKIEEYLRLGWKMGYKKKGENNGN